MSAQRRALPSWMSKRKPLRSRKKQKSSRTAFYCMNERELVDAAVSFLTNAAASGDVALLDDQQVEDKVKNVSWRITEKPKTPERLTELLQEEFWDCSDEQKRECVSETDLDITEVETLPYTGGSQHKDPEGQTSGPLQTETKEDQTQIPADPAEEDDALRLVREIFFT